MEGQGVTAPSAPAAGRQGEFGMGAVASAELDNPGQDRASGDVADDGDGQEHGQALSGDDSHVMVTPGHPEGSAGDASAPSSPEHQLTPDSQPPLPSRPTKTDKPNNIIDPDRNGKTFSGDENTGHDRSAADLEAQTGEAPHGEHAAPDAERAVPSGPAVNPELTETSAAPEDPSPPEDPPSAEDPAPSGDALAGDTPSGDAPSGD